MSHCKILYVCQEITPYLPESDMSVLCRALSQGMQERGNEIRTFMPRYGLINERRNQLHEVIRLSGMNLIIDNEDYFHRKAMIRDEDGAFFADNDERAIFFARGVLETVKKLRWSPDIVHCHGWFSSIVPVYLRNAFADDPVFKHTKIVLSVYDDAFEGELDPGFKSKIQGEGVGRKYLSHLDKPTYENLMKFVINYTDGVIFETPEPPEAIRDLLVEKKKRFLEYQDKSTPEYLDQYQAFYNKVLANE